MPRRVEDDSFFGKLVAELNQPPSKEVRHGPRAVERAKTELEQVNPELGLLMHRLAYECARLRDFYLSSTALKKDTIPGLAITRIREALANSIEPAKDALILQLLKKVGEKELRKREEEAIRRKTQFGYRRAPGVGEQTELELLDPEIGQFISHVEMQLGIVKNSLEDRGVQGIPEARSIVTSLLDEITGKETEFLAKYGKK